MMILFIHGRQNETFMIQLLLIGGIWYEKTFVFLRFVFFVVRLCN
ncbi:hypothetical protein TPHV1_40015 [Treponema phagedenis]|uniref:Uncharacterized protein n=1 Tax=Treponema phagedenis TaxID=162 RepID=A0A0B7GY51_TREPH|nr:hypothetical protein TPHV1_40015 [Treponema phagedenis]